MPRQDYEERKAARIERLEERAEKARNMSSANYATAKKMADVIPFGQPILVGHHSEGRDRRYRNRIHNRFAASAAASEQAARLEERASAAESNRAISSDDPEAIRKLKEKLEALQHEHAEEKAINAAWRKFKKNPASLDKAALSERRKELIRNFKPEWSKDSPIPAYSLTNRNGNMKRIRDRIAQLEQEFARAEEGDVETEYDGLKVVENVDENRVQLIFPGKPSAEIRSILKSHGFRWSRYNSAWQRHLNNAGIAAAKYVAAKVSE